MTSTLDVSDLRKQFAIGRPAIDGVSFAVPAGEIVVLLGPSGCGKTTTLRCVAGLEHPTGGEISIDGHLVSSPERGVLVPPRSRDLGMVFQSYAVWPHMTVRQNVIYPLKHRKIARAEAARKVDEVLELVGLTEFADRPVVALSGGQMQRVALARSIVYRPQLLLLDEPLSNLDAKLRLRLRDSRSSKKEYSQYREECSFQHEGYRVLVNSESRSGRPVERCRADASEGPGPSVVGVYKRSRTRGPPPPYSRPVGYEGAVRA